MTVPESDDDVRGALRTLNQDLVDWLAAEPRRESVARELTQRQGFLQELDYLRGLDSAEPWQQERLRLLSVGAEADRTRLAELRGEQQRHEEATARSLKAERTIFRFVELHVMYCPQR